jgi:hypothetical protein
VPKPSKDETNKSMEIRRPGGILRLYIAGPTSEHAPARLLAAGFVPVTLQPEPEASREWGHWARYALALLLTVDGVAVLPKSGTSRGAALACHVARELGLPVRTVPAWLTKAGQDAYMDRLLGEPPL